MRIHPDPETVMLQAFVDFIVAHAAWSGALIALIAFVEGLALVGTFMPGSTILIAVGAASSHSMEILVPLILCAAVGAIAGDTLSYRWGLTRGQQFLSRPSLVRHAAWVERTTRLVRWRGEIGVLVGRLCPPMRSIMPLVAGMSGLHLGRFVVADIVASTLWSAAHLGGGAYAIHLLHFSH